MEHRWGPIKGERRRPRIDWDGLEIAFVWNDSQSHAYLDLETGDVFQWSDFMGDEERAEVTDQIDEDPDRYERIEPPSSGEVWRLMEEFAESIADRTLHRLLDVALRGKGAFGGFKRALENFPSERNRWFAFHDERLHEAIEAWLADREVAPENEPPWRSRSGGQQADGPRAR